MMDNGKDLFQRLKAQHVDQCEDCDGTGTQQYIPKDQEDEDFPMTRGKRCDCMKHVQHLVGMNNANVPREFWDVESITMEFNRDKFEEVQRYCGKLGVARANGLGFVFTGENGVGKTACATYILSRAIRDRRTAFYTTLPGLMRHISRGYDRREISDWLEEKTQADFMVLDELGKEHAARDSTWVASEFDALIRRRRGALLPTVLITNLTAAELVDQYGESISSLMSDRMRTLRFRPGDYRVQRSDMWSDLMGGD